MSLAPRSACWAGEREPASLAAPSCSTAQARFSWPNAHGALGADSRNPIAAPRQFYYNLSSAHTQVRPEGAHRLDDLIAGIEALVKAERAAARGRDATIGHGYEHVVRVRRHALRIASGGRTINATAP